MRRKSLTKPTRHRKRKGLLKFLIEQSKIFPYDSKTNLEVTQYIEYFFCIEVDKSRS